jgi:hypothetical protein
VAEITEGYELSTEDCLGLEGVRSSVEMLADFSKRIGSAQGSQDLINRLTWLEGFMDRIGATGHLAQLQRQKGEYVIHGADFPKP